MIVQGILIFTAFLRAKFCVQILPATKCIIEEFWKPSQDAVYIVTAYGLQIVQTIRHAAHGLYLQDMPTMIDHICKYSPIRSCMQSIVINKL